MFKRLFWLAVGAGLGFGVSFWGMRMARQAVSRYSPQRLAADVRVVVKELASRRA